MVFLQVDNISVSKRTLLDIPGYKDKVEFGALTSFAYPVVDKGYQWWLFPVKQVYRE